MKCGVVCGLAKVVAGLILLSVSAIAIKAAPSSILIAPNAAWRYFDQGAPPADWKEPHFDDAAWPSGAAEFGYGEGDEATEVSSGPDPDRPYASVFFRKWFLVSSSEAFNRLDLGVLRDDGAIVYLNGIEIYRSNMPTGTVTHASYAATNVSGGFERVYYTTNFPPSILRDGTTNLLAVQVHQFSVTSDDLSFNLRLALTNVSPEIVRGPYLQSGSPTSVIVRWRTSGPADSQVRWGTATNDLSNTNASTALTTEHAVIVTGLTPDTRYYYGIGSSDGSLFTNNARFYFHTVPTNTRPFRIWAVGDAGTAGSAQRAVRDAYAAFTTNHAAHTDVWLMLGDNAYPAGRDSEYQRAVFAMYTNMLANTLLYPALGNHETYHTPNHEDIDYLRIFSLPVDGVAGGIPSGTELYYSFDYANMHFVCLDSMINSRSMDGAMYAWLEEDLAATTKDWIIAYWHHPPYTKGSHDSDREGNLVQMRQNIVPLLEANGVDLVLCGHSHSYERSFLLHGHYGTSDTLTPQMILDSGSGREDGRGPYRKRADRGTVYVVAGSSGQTSGGRLDHPAMYVSLNELGSLVIDVDDKRLHARFLREDGSLDDYFTFSKEPPPLEIISVAVTNSGVADLLTITWNSTPGTAYTVGRTETLQPMDWQPAGIVTATGSTTSWSEPVLPNRPTAFYRVSTP